MCLFVCMCICLSVCLPACLAVCLAGCLSACLSSCVYLCMHVAGAFSLVDPLAEFVIIRMPLRLWPFATSLTFVLAIFLFRCGAAMMVSLQSVLRSFPPPDVSWLQQQDLRCSQMMPREAVQQGHAALA